ncbi:MAG: DUF1080 domain-containing protein [Planctomycetota bacterium]
MSRTTILVLAVASCGIFPTAFSSANDGLSPADDGFRPLFNGKNLDGWRPVNTAPSTWSIQDGRLHCTGKPIGELRTKKMFQNFILEVEWRHLKPKGNAGIFVWADDITARGQPFHRGIEVQVLENAYGNTRGYSTHGDIFPIHGAKMKPVNGRGGSRAFPTENRSRPSPEWNHYRIHCQDGNISLAVNGKVVTRGTNCSPKKGYICLESEGGIVDYRNLRIKELPDTPVDKKDIAIEERGYRSLYTGVDLSGWKLAAEQKSWQVRDWVLHFDGKASGTNASLASTKSFSKVGFLFDVRAKKVSKELEVSVRGFTFSLSEKKLGKGWNRVEGVVVGDTLRVKLNGKSLFRQTQTSNGTSTPLKFQPVGSFDLANIFVRNPKKKPAAAKK